MQAGPTRIRLGVMPRKPRVMLGSLNAVTVEMAEMIDREVDARVGPNATFEERQDAAAAIAAEVAAEFAKLPTRAPKAGS